MTENGDNEPLNLMSITTFCALDSSRDFRFFHLDYFLKIVFFIIPLNEIFCSKLSVLSESLFITLILDRYFMRYKIMDWQLLVFGGNNSTVFWFPLLLLIN